VSLAVVLLPLKRREVPMSKREYLECVLRLLTPEQIMLSASSPTQHMKPIHIKLHYVALRRLGVI
jgi:hypothetical protein